MTLNFCANRGTLTAPRRLIPADPTVFLYTGCSLLIPCSNVVCSRCSATVRCFDGLNIDGPRSLLAAAYAAPDPRGLDGVRRGESGCRQYLCRCSAYLCRGAIGLYLAKDMEYRTGLPQTWACAGHPPRSLPTKIDGVAVPEEPSWSAIVRNALRRDPASFEGIKWVREAYGALTGTRHPAAIDAILGGLLSSAEPRLRAGAIYVLWSAQELPSTDRLPALLEEDVESLRAQTDPFGMGDLYNVLVCAIAYHLDRGRWSSPRLLPALRAHVLTPDRAGGCGWFLARADPQWFLDHADQMLRSSPQSAEKIGRWRAEATAYLAMLG